MDNKAAMKLGGAKRKNGHKMNCDCHICENMKNKAKRGGYEKDEQKKILNMMGGSKKKNGHRPDCTCPICKNMRNAKGKTMKVGKSMKGGKKSNGHKMNCVCPICKNMSKKSKKGGEGEGNGGEEAQDNELLLKATDAEYENVENIPESRDEEQKKINESIPIDETGNALSSETLNVSGGRKRKTTRKSMEKSMKKRGNGHKANCGCPICKNMRKGKGTKRR